MDIDELIERKLVHEIHTSERRSFRSCRRRWDWIFRQNYYPKMTAKPLEFGVAYHKAMEVYYNPETWDWDDEVRRATAIGEFAKVCREQKQAALEATDMPYLVDEVEEDYEERVELGKGMLKYYFNEVAPVEDKGWRPVRVEIGFMVAIPHPETGEDLWCKCQQCWDKINKFKNGGGSPKDVSDLFTERGSWKGLPVVYAGRLDMLAVDERGYYYIFDWKTAARISQDHEFLDLDDQIVSYVWALRKLGIDVKGFVYHEQRKAYPQPPVKNKQRRLGRIFSVNKNQAVDYDSYLKAIKEEDAAAYEEGLYEEMLTYLENEKAPFHQRFQINKSCAELTQMEKMIGYEALEIINPALAIYPNPGRFGCNFCAFRQPCLEVNTVGDVQYALDTLFEKREHYYVRQDASTESKGGE